MMSHQRYQQSGSYSASGVLVALLVGSAIAAVMSPIYALALVYIPFAFINCFVVFGYGLAVGFGVAYGCKAGKVRSSGLAAKCGVAVGVLACYFGWVSWLLVASRRLIFLPADLLSTLRAVAATGSWSIGQSTPTGVVLYMIWVAELLAICLLAAFAARFKMDEEVFCETCAAWLSAPTKIGPLECISSDGTIAPEQLELLQPLAPAASPATHLELRSCASCQGLNVITVKVMTSATDKNGKVSTREQTIVSNLISSWALNQRLLAKRGAV